MENWKPVHRQSTSLLEPNLSRDYKIMIWMIIILFLLLLAVCALGDHRKSETLSQSNTRTAAERVGI